MRGIAIFLIGFLQWSFADKTSTYEDRLQMLENKLIAMENSYGKVYSMFVSFLLFALFLFCLALLCFALIHFLLH